MPLTTAEISAYSVAFALAFEEEPYGYDIRLLPGFSVLPVRVFPAIALSQEQTVYMPSNQAAVG
jgi:hypothetical protein